ncbi:hypothetical protein J2755_000293 [Methanohalophilus levihalophilus]|uniref:hypothetical protein n=1 Tax=Methanohalophilus levihalophilus TaxID=1431282 RepID=UPI001AE2126E|nr:hypothetical protein [Methanohalophilus levihalophilus]MBP2029373.1 hypothetical protein [Methanohalophilus levihalophilus]
MFIVEAVIKVKYALITALFLFMLFSGIAAASPSYWIDENNDMWLKENITAGNTITLYTIQEAGYSPNASLIFLDYEDGEAYNDGDGLKTVGGWTQGNTFNGNGINEYSNDQAHSGSISLHIEDSGGELYRSSPTTTLPQIIEGMIYVPSTDISSARTYFSLYEGSTSWGYSNGVSVLSRGTKWYVGYGGTEYVTTTSLTTGWHKATIKANSDGSADLYVDGSLLSVSAPSGTLNNADNKICIGSYGGGHHSYYDDIRVRTHAATEPTVIITDMGSYYKVEIENTGGNDLTNYQVKLDGTELGITGQSESWDVNYSPVTSISVNLTAPSNNSYVNDNNFTFDISGNGILNASVYVDSVPQWNGSVIEGNNTVNFSISEGFHSWYVNASATANGTLYNESEIWHFTYDISPAAATQTILNPSGDVVVNQTFYLSVLWTDTALKNGSFYYNTGSGWTFDTSTGLSGSSDWFNSSFNTTGHLGDTVYWKQEIYDQAGNLKNLSGSFEVVNSALDIYVYDESNQTQILPSDVTVYDANISISASISGVTKVASVSYTELTETGKYVVQVEADGYYNRKGIVYVDRVGLSRLDIYLPAESESVIYESFTLTDNTATYTNSLSDCILRLQKPLPNGTTTVYETYLDFDGTAKTYLIVDNQYILYIITPDRTINYGWLTPDPDGSIDVVIKEVLIDHLFDQWMNYTQSTTSEMGVISLDYEATKDLDIARMNITYSSNDTVVYSASATTLTGSFLFTGDNTTNYYINFYAKATDGDEYNAMVPVIWTGSGVQPKRFDIVPSDWPDWVTEVIATGIVLIAILLLSPLGAHIATAIGAALMGLFWWWGWLQIAGIVVALAVLIAIAAFAYRSRRAGL